MQSALAVHSVHTYVLVCTRTYDDFQKFEGTPNAKCLLFNKNLRRLCRTYTKKRHDEEFSQIE